MDVSEYLTSDATTLAALVAAKKVTAGELLGLARRRSDAVNPTLNAVVMPLPEVADARAADPSLSGHFAGVPFLVKDLGQEYAAFPTSCGSRALANDVADRHALVTQRFLDAGLVIFGKTNTPEFGAKGSPSPSSGARRATPGAPPTPPAARRAGPAPRSPPASCRRPAPTTAGARSGSRRPATAWWGSRPVAGSAPTVRRPAR